MCSSTSAGIEQSLTYRTFFWTAKCELDVRDLLAEFTRGGGGGGGVIFVNGSSDQLQTENQDSQYHFAPLLFRRDLSISYWWPLASFGKFI